MINVFNSFPLIFIFVHTHICIYVPVYVFIYTFFCNGGKAAVYAFVRFPRGCASKSVSFSAADNKCAKLLRYDIELPSIISALDLNLLENLINFKQRVDNDSKVCDSLLLL